MINKLGYACLCLSLGKSITVNRGMIKKTFIERGISYASELALKNVQDLEKILQWNESMGIKLYRMSSDMFPWASEYSIVDLPDILEIMQVCARIGKFAKDNNHRLSFHPGPFTVIASANKQVVEKSILDLEIHGAIMDMMDLQKSPYNKINIHVNTTAEGKTASMTRFCESYQRLSESVKTRLVVENDDKPKQYTVDDLMFIHRHIGIPITFDYFHHSLNPGDQTEEEALILASTTWPADITQATHYSESKRLHENNPKENARSHSDYVNSLPNTYGLDIDVVLEAKSKDLAVLKIR